MSTSGYSSVTDSQLFVGSQFWPENSQAASQSVSLSSKTSTQNSQEGSDPIPLSSYQTKPLLFGEAKEKSKGFNILDKFEEDKKKTKENLDSNILANECVYIRDTLNKIQQLATGTEKNSAVFHTVLEKIDGFASALQNNLISLQSDISLQLQTLLNKVNSQSEAMTGLVDRMEKTGCTTTELGSSVLSLKNSVECLKKDHESERDMLEEALKLLSALVSKDSAKPSPVTVMDSIIQTSPSLTQSFCKSLQENTLESSQPSGICKAVPHQDTTCFIGKRKRSKFFSARRKKRPLVIPQKSKQAISEEKRPSPINCIKKPLSERNNLKENRSPEASRCFYTPLSCWSQDSNSSACLNGIEPILDTTEPSVKPGGLWQLFELGCEFDEDF